MRSHSHYFISPLVLLAVVFISWGDATSVNAAGTVIEYPLWPKGAPDDNGLKGDERPGGCVGNVSKATYTVYLPEKDKATGAAVVITPGGGYGVVCVHSEGKNIADILVPRGIAAIVVKYRLPNGRHTIPANDARRAMRTVRHNAKAWNIDPNKVGVWGFSAGGHLASTVSTVFDDGNKESDDAIEKMGSRPDFSILFYPVISMDEKITHMGSRNNLIEKNASVEMVDLYSNEKRVTKKTPPTFMLHATDDPAVKVANSLRYYASLVENKVPATLLIYEKGGHGPNAFNKNPSWLPAFEKWLKARAALK